MSAGLEPSAKRRKLGPSATQLTQQPSFAEVLEQLMMDASQNGTGLSSRTSLGAGPDDSRVFLASEDDADLWSRPPLKPLSEKTDTISV